MRTLLWKITAIFVLAATLITGCASIEEQEVQPLRIEWTLGEGDYTLLIAQEKGYFDKYGVQVVPIYYEILNRAIADLAGGKIDAGLFAIDNLLAATRLTEVKCVAVSDTGGSSAIIAAESLKSPEELRGQSIGVSLGSFAELFVREMLSENGLSIRDVTLVNMTPEEVPGRIPYEIIAGYTGEPYTTEALTQGHKVLYSSGDEGVGSLYPNVIVLRSQWAEENPDKVRAFLNAWFDAVEFRKNNPEESRQIIANYSGREDDEIISGDVNLYSREDNLNLFKNYPGNDTTSIYYTAQANLDFMIANGGLTTAPKLLEVLDPSYLK